MPEAEALALVGNPPQQAKMARTRREYHLTTLTSDLLGLSSFHSPGTFRCAYRCLVILAVVTFHAYYVTHSHVSTSMRFAFFRARIWCLFASAVVIFAAQVLRGDAIRECHLLCSDFPPSFPFLRLLLHFCIFLTHFLIYQFFYVSLFYQNFVYFALLIFCVQVPTIQFDYLLASVRGKIWAVNEQLEKFVSKGNPSLFYISRTRGNGEEILKIHQKYVTLTDVASRVTSSYSCQIFVVIVEFSLEIFFILQASLFEIIEDAESSHDVLDFTFKTYVVASLFYKLLIAARSGQKYLEECQRTDALLCRIMNTNPGNNSEAKDFILQNMLNPASVPILGFFQLNYAILYKFGCSIVNYGIITGIMYIGMLKKQGQLEGREGM